MPNGEIQYEYRIDSIQYHYNLDFIYRETPNVTMGGTVTTFARLGAGVIIETSAHNNITLGFEHSETWVDENTTTSIITTSKRWQTSDEENFVGSGGDIIIGHSTNIVYGKCTFIDLLKSDDGEGHVGNPINGYKIGKFVGIRMNTEFGTAFQYSQNHIKNYLIPNLEMLRNSFLATATDYTSHYPQDNEYYGSDNITQTTSDSVNYTGNSYNFSIPDDWQQDSLFTDTVWHFNQQIKEWEKILKQNEKQKVNSILDQNLSFDAGVIYESYETHDTTTTETETFEWMVSPRIAYETGFSINGSLGALINIEQTYEHRETKTDGTTTTNEVTFGYVLNDGNARDYLSVDVKTPKAHTGPVFMTRGGQTMCPYEGEEVTEYYQPGMILNAETLFIRFRLRTRMQVQNLHFQ